MSTERDLQGWTIAFDLDGTLVDSAPDLIGTLNRMLAQYELPPVPMSSARHLVGHGAMALLRHGFLEAGAAWDEAHAPGLFERVIEDYLAHIADESRPFDGCVAALDRLSARGATLCVALYLSGVVGFMGGGLNDIILFNWVFYAKNHAHLIWIHLALGLGFAAINFFVFRYMILKFNFLTPGRGDEEEEE